MQSARSLIVSVGALLGLAMVVSVVGLTQEPDSGGVGRDTYGVRAHGYRGVLETLAELGVDAERRLAPPADTLPLEATIAVLEPTPPLVAREPAYLARVGRWVERGGRLVVAPPLGATRVRYARDTEGDTTSSGRDRSLLEVLGLSGVAVVEGDPIDADASDSEWTDNDGFESWGRVFESRAQGDTRRHDVGWWGDNPRTLSLALPAGQVVTIETAGVEHEPLLWRETPGGADELLAASFPRGEGEIVLVADPDLFANALVRQGDNSVAVVGLLSPTGGPVVFDEHYHGLGPSGSALYLLTRPGFAVVTIALLAATAVWAWRTSVALGPPIATPQKPRRDLREYVEAMARLLLRGTDGRRYLLGELRQGVLEELGRRLGLSVLTPTPDRVAAALARRDRARAEAFTNTIDAIDRRLAQRSSLGVAETTRLMQRANSCL